MHYGSKLATAAGATPVDMSALRQILATAPSDAGRGAPAVNPGSAYERAVSLG